MKTLKEEIAGLIIYSVDKEIKDQWVCSEALADHILSLIKSRLPEEKDSFMSGKWTEGYNSALKEIKDLLV